MIITEYIPTPPRSVNPNFLIREEGKNLKLNVLSLPESSNDQHQITLRSVSYTSQSIIIQLTDCPLK